MTMEDIDKAENELKAVELDIATYKRQLNWLEWRKASLERHLENLKAEFSETERTN